MPPFDLFAEPSPADTARLLARRWGRMCAQPIAFQAGCGCGFPAAHIQPSEIEPDIVDFLQRKYRDSANDAAKRAVAGAASLETILQRLCDAPAGSADAAPLLADIRRSLSSFDRTMPRCAPA